MGLEALERVLRSIPEERTRGNAFERVVCTWLTSELEFGFGAAWLWAEWPGRVTRGLPGSDDGIDLVAEDRDGQLVAIQVKFRSDPTRAITREEAQKSLSYGHVFERYLVVSNAWDRTLSARRGLKSDNRLSWVLRPDMLDSTFDWPSALTGKALATEPPQPRGHQLRAISAAIEALREPGRAQLRMACGTGKTLTTLWVAEGLEANRTLVLAPTLLLLKQLRAEWLRAASQPFAALAVCSSDDVGEGGDSWELDPADIPGEVTTDPARIAEFLRRSGRRVVFSTYQSSPRITNAVQKDDVPSFDLVVADEAHKIAGVSRRQGGGYTGHRSVLDAKAIPSDRRLFVTATPRVYGPGRQRQLEDDFGVEVASMDDEALFGRVSHEFGFRAAVEAGILVDFRLLITIADDQAAEDAIRERHFVDLNGRPVDAEQLATAIAVRRAIDEFGFHRVISFHSTVARARTFAGLVPEVPLDGVAPSTMWISGGQPVGDRELVLTQLDTSSGPVLVTNARCLTEGIDVPALDAVVFADPRRSPVDLVQAIGRAMRSSDGKLAGWIVVPVHLGPNELNDTRAALEGSQFAPVVAVLRALRSHDPLLASQAARIVLSLGRRSLGEEEVQEYLSVEVVGPAGIDAEQLVDAIRLRAAEVSADPWSSGLEALRRFASREGHCRVPARWMEAHVRLGGWVSHRREEYLSGSLSARRAAELEALPGWSWNPREDDWLEGIQALRIFAGREGHARVPPKWIEGAVKLGGWVAQRRVERLRGELRAERVAELNAFDGWSWEPRRDDWLRAMAALRSFVSREGHSQVPQSHVEGEIRLGTWVTSQRSLYRRGAMDQTLAGELEEIPGWRWDPLANRWERGIGALLAFTQREGHARVPASWTEGDYPLGAWIANCRAAYRRGELSPVRQAELLRLPGWTWRPLTDDWDRGIAALRTFANREGHPRVPQTWKEGQVRLGGWVAARRNEYRRGSLDASRVSELEAITGWVWDPYAAGWAGAMAALAAFAAREGHARVPRGHIEGGVRLGVWIGSRRREYRRGSLSSARIAELEAVTGWVWDTDAADWAAAMAALHAFVAREGHARVSYAHVERGFRLGAWVKNRRQDHRKGTLSQAKISELEALPGWVWRPEAR